MTRVALALLVIVGVGLMKRRRRPVQQPDDIDWLAEYRCGLCTPLKVG